MAKKYGCIIDMIDSLNVVVADGSKKNISPVVNVLERV